MNYVVVLQEEMTDLQISEKSEASTVFRNLNVSLSQPEGMFAQGNESRIATADFFFPSAVTSSANFFILC